MWRLTKKDISILLGNVLDHFDIALFGFFAPLLGPVFFPAYDPVVQLILTYGLSITSLLSKPIGTYLFGIILQFVYGFGIWQALCMHQRYILR